MIHRIVNKSMKKKDNIQ